MSGGEAAWGFVGLWAWGPFASAALLWWGAAALIPLVIHLWKRRQYREQEWAATSFLRAALRRQARRMWFEQWALLALRIMACGLLALALAEPYWRGLADVIPAAGESISTHHILVLDASYSMDYRAGGPGERSAFDAARDALAEQVRRAPLGDGYSLVLLEDVPRAAIQEPSFDRHTAWDELRAQRMTNGGADVRASLNLIERLKDDARQRFPRLQRTRIVFATDLGRQGWEEAVARETAPVWERLAEEASLEWVDVGGEQGENTAITSLRLADSLAVVGRDARFEATLRNFGARDVRAVSVEFEVDGRPVGVRTVDVIAGGQTIVAADVRLDGVGDRLVSVAIRGDRLPLDNRRWLSVPVRDRARVLCVEGKLDEARYLALALDPFPREASLVRVEVAAESALLDRSLASYELICLCNVGRLTAAESRALRGYVAHGGRLAIFLGDETHVDNYNQELGGTDSPDERLRLLPARLQGPPVSGLRQIDPRDYRDPLTLPFRGQEQAGLLSTPVWCYWPGELFDDDAAQVAVAFENGDPWIVHERRAQGEVWLVTSAASLRSRQPGVTPPTPWSAWATWPSFPPMIQQLLRESLAGRIELRNVLVGQPLAGRFARNSPEGDVLIVPPEEGEGGGKLPRRAKEERGDDELRWSFDATGTAGVYVARRGATENDEQRFAVNLDTRESDLTRLDPTLLPARLRRESPAGDASQPQEPVPSRELALFRPVLMLVLFVLVAESVAGWWLGRGEERQRGRSLGPRLHGEGSAAPAGALDADGGMARVDKDRETGIGVGSGNHD